MIIITKQQYRIMIDHGLMTLPNEACGLIGGTIQNGIKKIQKIYKLTNMDESPEHFSMNPKEQFAVVKDMRKNGWEMLGNFHSHPSTPSRPSDEDKRLAFDSRGSYIIISLMDKENIVLKSFNISQGKVQEEKLIIEGENDYGSDRL